MAAYLMTYAEAFGLREQIRFRVTVERLEPQPDGAWRVYLDDGAARRYVRLAMSFARATGPILWTQLE